MMGLFDYIKCEAPLPETPTPPTSDQFQTKDTPDQYMTVYTITADGKLVWKPYIIEVVPKSERPHPDKDGLLGMRGIWRRVESDPEEVNFHGDIHFYDSGNRSGWWEYKARFTEGKLSRIELVEYRPPHPSNT